MSKRTGPKSFSEGKDITEKWCSGDKAYVDKSAREHGFMDQVIAKAEKKYRTKFFLNARFYRKCSCMIMQAEVAKQGRRRSRKGNRRRR
jgi:hypothetical protein